MIGQAVFSTLVFPNYRACVGFGGGGGGGGGGCSGKGVTHSVPNITRILPGMNLMKITQYPNEHL